jgi:chemotaxis signal transduction protein
MNESTRNLSGDQTEEQSRFIEKQSRVVNEIKALETRLISLKSELVRDRITAAGAESTDQRLSVTLFSVADRTIGLPLSYIEQVELMPAIAAPVQNSTAVIGVANYHGEHLLVFDLATLSGLPPRTIEADRVLIVCDLSPFRFGLMADEAIDVITLTREELLSSQDTLIDKSLSLGLIRWKEKPAVILDIWAIAASARQQDATVQSPSDGSETPAGSTAPGKND